MDIYIEAKPVSIHKKMAVKDADGNDIYHISSSAISGLKTHVCDPSGNELLCIHEKIPAVTPKFWLEKGGDRLAEVKRKIGVHHNFEIDGLGWTAEGDITGHQYSILDSNGETICTVEKAWKAWGESYHAWISDNTDSVICIGVIVSFDKAEAVQQDSEATALNDTLNSGFAGGN